MVQPTLSKDFVAAFAKSEQKFSSPRRKKVFVGVGIVFAVLLFIGLIGAFLVTRVLAMKGDALAVRTAASEAYDAIKSQNLPEAANKLTVLSDRTHVLYQKTQAFSWMRVIPIVGNYYGDLQHGFTAGFAGIEAAQRAVAEIEPYADVLGFKGQGTFNGGSAQDRIAKILETLSKITPALDDISGKLSIVDKELSAINERRYPEKIGTTVIRSRITQAKELVHGASTALVQNRSAVELLPDVAGATTRKKYLIIFQNSGELRPTGGFMTAYATINIDKGKVEPENSGDIYDIDAKFTNKP
ncbi:MAG TPA: DUF4012 domain-containing protein, partial [Patescibacteria group bacterium]|nr:DUF4012 domain-containing protein [Patescibacteria group bacterium]